ncbi:MULTISPECIES: aminotransferase class I/II-fold pyridoxal phosphate-dependent enzyme [Streptomyces]|uniref:aminotransferase class I/II-fold pyridoxal phosphate-dependent enzyme n=1 Tax=Streptomyces TaxID=1883 RepID=UPI00163C7262|nr:MULTISPECIES: ornithine decarboxylase [Streptomyces]MBC2879004.1 ornithine decarboxylase [Streptomyces sp. TYQ1024]UBI40647.1 ornithine decarboxylase [Streptomyces mobaraensis]UKW33230.1 ornithine decarboxylase [Streptomyces sp. TYQ1024]
MDHTQAPVLEALAAYHEAGRLPFTPPGHKQARGADPAARRELGDAVFRADVLATGGLDDRRTSGRVLERAEALMAEAVHAEHTFFTTCGSSLSVKAAMLAVASPHEELLVGRDAHKSVVAGLILAGIRPVWVEPQWDAQRYLAHPPSAAAFERAFAAHPDARGALVTSPTPYGSCADLEGIAEVCHRRGRPLIVDEAWGAHLPFHPDLPAWAMDAGADVCVTSIHKMGSGLEQGSVFHLQGDLIDPAALKSRADLLGTTSPSVLILAGIDGWRRQMMLHGRELLDHALERAASVRKRIERIDGLHVNDRADFTGSGLAADLDPLPVIIDMAELGTTGYRAADWLRDKHRIDLHLVDHRRISAQLTHADDEETVRTLLGALRDLSERASGLRPAPAVAVPSPRELRMEQVLPPRDAYFGPVEDVPHDRAEGRIAAEMLTPYPPGIPAALPGERLTGPVLEYLRTGIEAGMNLPDAADPELRTVRVARETDGS